ncbi:MAG: DUF3142 domain-containing protein [Rickettsiales bacterium]|nr:MAG: DUF3142 domain-containing protein [Rickettsiales bacterium]
MFNLIRKKNLYILLYLTFLIYIGYLCFIRIHTKYHYYEAYWIWAGITAKEAPKNSKLYIYQGSVTKGNYNHIGLFPYPIDGRELYLTYRIDENLPNEHYILDLFLKSSKKWEKHSSIIKGLQLDFDSPTFKLSVYNSFLKQIRNILPKKYKLSITGLGDWILNGNTKILKAIDRNTDEIIFQLYQGTKHLPNIDSYVWKLRYYQFPFRIGLLHLDYDQKIIDFLKINPNFRGVNYFIQKR